MKNIYVGNLPYDATDSDLAQAFSEFGPVHRATLVYHRETGRPRGFGFVEMDDDEAADFAIERMHGHEFLGRPLTVNEARRHHEEQAPAMHAREPMRFGSNHRQQFRAQQQSAPGTEPMQPPARDDAPEILTSRGYSNSVYTREAG